MSEPTQLVIVRIFELKFQIFTNMHCFQIFKTLGGENTCFIMQSLFVTAEQNYVHMTGIVGDVCDYSPGKDKLMTARNL